MNTNKEERTNTEIVWVMDAEGFLVQKEIELRSKSDSK